VTEVGATIVTVEEGAVEEVRRERDKCGRGILIMMIMEIERDSDFEDNFCENFYLSVQVLFFIIYHNLFWYPPNTK